MYAAEFVAATDERHAPMAFPPRRLALLPAALLLTATVTTAPAVAAPGQVLFDDFSYSSSTDPLVLQRGWRVRDYQGGPGVPGAVWSPGQITFPGSGAEKVMRLSGVTDGSAAGTRQAEISHQRKFFEGTYSARVRFSDRPTSGPDGDQLVQTFFTITPLAFPRDPDYSEQDFEYLPNGGWGTTGPNMFCTSYETYQADPWWVDSESEHEATGLDGWHVLTLQVMNGTMRYFVDDRLVVEHGGRLYPETPQMINFSQWFIGGGLVGGSTTRGYEMDVDWVYYADDERLSPTQVRDRVVAQRNSGQSFVDTVPM
ncbi:glycoside hydrolase family 16 protein [Allokutzneria oryzae]|uniref:Glycoside hydrolase family 16 protein n=1 Tax=Allokutzneria oryzae TaxID=1378989 RepID=A0ABV5ZT24_9PSEU